MIVQHNMAAAFTNRQLRMNKKQGAARAERLSTGYRINRAADDAAGLSISEKMRGQIRGLQQASRNVEDGISLIQTADGAMQEVDNILLRMRTLCVQAANDTYITADREQIQEEIGQLIQEVDYIGKETEFNTIKILQGKEHPVGEEVWVPDVHTEEFIPAYELVTFKDGDLFNDDPPYQPPDNNSYVKTSRTLDFSRVNEKNKSALKDASFQFGCSWSCDQKFFFKFVDGFTDNNDVSHGVKDLTPTHDIDTSGADGSKEFHIDINSFKDGKELASHLQDFVINMNQNGVADKNKHQVGHANYLYAEEGKIIICGEEKGNDPTHPRDYELFTSTDLKGIMIENDIPGHYETRYHYETRPYDLIIQSGANSRQILKLTLPIIDADTVGIRNVDVSTGKLAGQSIDMLDDALHYVDGERSRMGAYQNRMEHTKDNVDNSAEQLTAAESRIRDADMADEIVAFSRSNILMQAAQSMLAQANESPNGILTLLGM